MADSAKRSSAARRQAQRLFPEGLPELKPAFIRDEAWEVLVLHVGEGVTFAEVARRLRRSTAWCRSQVTEALRLIDSGGAPQMYGELGVLASDGERVQCHVCGRWYSHLGAHVRMKHDMEAAEYKRLFGLMAKTGLLSPELADKRRDTSHLRAYDEEHQERMRSLTSEEQSRRATAQEFREEQLLDPAYQERVSKFAKSGIEAVARARAEGRYHESGWPEEATRKGQEAIRRLRQDSDFRRWLGERISQGKAAGSGRKPEVREAFAAGAKERAE